MTDDAETPWEPFAGSGGRRRGRAAVAVVVMLVLVVLAGAVSGVFDTGGDEGLSVDTDGGPAPSEGAGGDDELRWTAFPALDHAQAVAPAGDGGVWVVTQSGGVLRWDAEGADYERHMPFGEQDADGVTAVAVADDGTVWAAHADHGGPNPAGEGVVRFDGEAWTTYTEADGLASNAVHELAVGPGGTVWAATEAGVSMFDDGEWTTYTTADGLPHPRVRAVTVSDDGTVWARTRDRSFPDEGTDGVAHFDGETWRGWSTDGSVPGAEVTALATGPDGTGWIATRDGSYGSADLHAPRLWRVEEDGEAWIAAAAGEDLAGGSVQDLALDGDGAVWAAPRPSRGEPATVARFADGRWQRFTADDGLPAGAVESLTADGDGAVWAATSGGAARFRGDGGWAVYATGQGPTHDTVRSVATGEHGALWAATSYGLSRYDGQTTWTEWTVQDGLAGNVVTAVEVGPDGSVWAGTDNGLSRFDGETWTSWTGDDGPGPIAALAVADDGAVWTMTDPMANSVSSSPDRDPSLAAERHLVRFDGRVWHSWPVADALAGRQPTTVAVTADGAVWVGTRRRMTAGVHVLDEKAPLARFEGGEWTVFTTADGLPAGAVFDVATDGDRTWAATTEGVARFDGQQWVTHASEGDPLALDGAHPAASGRIPAVAPADNGGLWAATDSGLLRFDGQEWTVHAHDGDHTNALALDADGVWLGTWDGLRRFNTIQP